MCSKRVMFSMLSLCFLLAFSPLSAQSSPSPDGMTDAEIIAELMSNLEKREASIKEQEAQLKSDREALTKDREALTREQKIFEDRKALQAETERYWKNYKKDRLRDRLIDFGVGFAAGFATGNYTGFKLGVKIDY